MSFYTIKIYRNYGRKNRNNSLTTVELQLQNGNPNKHNHLPKIKKKNACKIHIAT